MKRIFLFIVIISLIISGCQNPEKNDSQKWSTPVPKEEIDTNMVLSIFEKVRNEHDFLVEILPLEGAEYTMYSGERPILIGDLNGDGKFDALMPFAIEIKNGYGEEDTEPHLFYAFFLNHNGLLKWKMNFNRNNQFLGRTITFEAFETGYMQGNLSRFSSDQEKEPVTFKWSDDTEELVKIKDNKYYWSYEGLKLNGKYSLNATKEEVLKLVSMPDSVTNYFRDCNAGGGPKEVYHFGKLILEFNEEKRLDIDDYNFDNNQNLFLTFNQIRLDKHTRYEDMLKLSPDILNQHPDFNEGENEEISTDFQTIWIPLEKSFNDYSYMGDYYGRVWICLNFYNGFLSSASIPSENCEI